LIRARINPREQSLFHAIRRVIRFGIAFRILFVQIFTETAAFLGDFSEYDPPAAFHLSSENFPLLSSAREPTHEALFPDFARADTAWASRLSDLEVCKIYSKSGTRKR